jgi:hypothetical protein
MCEGGEGVGGQRKIIVAVVTKTVLTVITAMILNVECAIL